MIGCPMLFFNTRARSGVVLRRFGSMTPERFVLAISVLVQTILLSHDDLREWFDTIVSAKHMPDVVNETKLLGFAAIQAADRQSGPVNIEEKRRCRSLSAPRS